MATITNIYGQTIRDSRGTPTLEITVEVEGGIGNFKVPSGASTGIHEAHELRDADKGMSLALISLETIVKPVLVGMDAYDQEAIDQAMIELDGTPNKSKIGGNVMIGVSIATARAEARARGQELYAYLKERYQTPSASLPRLYVNLSGGGKHAKGPAFQEYHIIPQTNDPKQALEAVASFWNTFVALAKESYGENLVPGDEGGLTIPTDDVRAPLELFRKAAEQSSTTGILAFSLDVAASSFYENGSYHIGDQLLSRDNLMELYDELIRDFPLVSIEDPFDEEDFEGFRILKERYPEVNIIGDDLTVTNQGRLQQAIDANAVGGLIIKPNQVGTLSETVATVRLAQEHSLKTIVSHRSGETTDDAIADIVIGLGCSGLKAGDPSIPIRGMKYDRLVTIINHG